MLAALLSLFAVSATVPGTHAAAVCSRLLTREARARVAEVELPVVSRALLLDYSLGLYTPTPRSA